MENKNIENQSEKKTENLPASVIRTDLTFKNVKLNEAAKTLAIIYARQEKDKKDVCVLLYSLEKDKAYKEDGFKSLAEFAEKIGLDKSLAHKYENAGRLYANENEEIRKFAEKTDYSKLAILASADPVKVNKAITDGTLKSDMTQEGVKAWKESVSEKRRRDEKRKTYKAVEAHIPPDGGKGKKQPTATSKEYPNAIRAEVPQFGDYTLSFHKVDESIYHVGFKVDSKGIHLALIEECEYKPEVGMPGKEQAVKNANKRAADAEARLEKLMRALAEKGITID